MNKKYFFCESIPLIVFVGLSYLVLSQATNIPFWDEWFVPTLFDHYYSGTLTLKYLVFVHGDHVLAFPQIIILLMGILTQWDVRIELFINLALGLYIYLLYRFVVLKMSNNTKNQNILLLPIVGIFVFSFVQWHNWTWGWQMQIFISIATSLTTLFILTFKNINIKNLLIAIFFSLLSSFSFASGISLWIIGILLIAIRANKPILYLLWAIPSAACFYIYYLLRPKQLSLENISLIDSIEYIIIYIGNPVSPWREDIVFFIGLAGVFLLFICLFLNRDLDDYSLFFLSIIIFVIMTAILTSIGRSHHLDSPTVSRYSSFSIHYWIAIICLIFKPGKSRNFLVKNLRHISILVIPILSIIISYASIDSFYVKKERTLIINYLLDPSSVPENQVNFKAIIWNRAYLERQVALLKKYQLSFYANP